MAPSITRQTSSFAAAGSIIPTPSRASFVLLNREFWGRNREIPAAKPERFPGCGSYPGINRVIAGAASFSSLTWLPRAHRRRRDRPRAGGARHVGTRDQKIAGDQLYAVVGVGEESIPQHDQSSAGGGRAPEPVAELPARWPGEPGGPRLQIVGLQVVGGEAELQNRGKTGARARRFSAAQPLADIAAELRHRQPAQPDRCAIVRRRPPFVGVSERRYLNIEPRGERRRAVGRDREQRWWTPGGVGLLARVVVREILDDDRTSLAVEQPQCRKNNPSLKRRVTRRTERTAEVERHPQRPRRSR